MLTLNVQFTYGSFNITLDEDISVFHLKEFINTLCFNCDTPLLGDEFAIFKNGVPISGNYNLSTIFIDNEYLEYKMVNSAYGVE